MEFNNIIEINEYIGGIPVIIMRPIEKRESYPTVVFYHGWTSKKEYQRFRGYILASLGYQVVIPDALNHGERGEIDYYAKENAGRFWEVVLQNLAEFKDLSTELIQKYNADKDRIAVTGHSMGGFSTAGIFAENKDIKTAVVVNGSFDWMASNEIFKRTLGVNDAPYFKELEKRVKEKTPADKISSLLERPLLILHGGADKVVDITPQKEFYEKLRLDYKENEGLKMVTYSNLGHFMSVNMVEEMSKWFHKYL
ncbi:MAG: alpha/beta fold hydrolase [Gudongella sp.]|nr:alpha/beta fold hydrolase [Gudongella sp.]